MWTRGELASNNANLIVPWNMPVRCGQRGRMIGSYPGYGAGLMGGGYMPIEPGLHRSGAIAPGFGIAMDPSDPSTWQKPVKFTGTAGTGP